MADLIGVQDKVKRAKELEKIGVDYLCIHIGIDEQMIGKKPVDILKSIVKNTETPVAVAGGLNSETVADVVKAGASVIIVGGAITKAKDIEGVSRRFLKMMKEEIDQFRVMTDF